MAFKGALSYKSADLTAQNVTTAAAVTFNTDSYDTDAIHDTSSNTSRMTVPSGVTEVKLAARVLVDLLTNNEMVTLEIKKNGSSLVPAVNQTNTVFLANPRLSIATPKLQVTPGDYFEVFVSVPTDTSITIGANSWLAMWEVPAVPVAFSGAVVKKAADQTAANYTTATALAFDAETLDVGTWHDTVTNNERLTVPSGVAYAQFMLQVGVTGLSAGEWILPTIRKTGAAMTPVVNGIFMTASALTSPKVQVITPPLPVSAADWFDTTLQVSTDTSITVVALETTFSVMALA